MHLMGDPSVDDGLKSDGLSQQVSAAVENLSVIPMSVMAPGTIGEVCWRCTR